MSDKDEISRLAAELAEARAALEQYGMHLAECVWYRNDETACDCGLDEALRGTERTTSVPNEAPPGTLYTSGLATQPAAGLSNPEVVEDLINYGQAFVKDGKRVDPAEVRGFADADNLKSRLKDAEIARATDQTSTSLPIAHAPDCGVWVIGKPGICTCHPEIQTPAGPTK